MWEESIIERSPGRIFKATNAESTTLRGLRKIIKESPQKKYDYFIYAIVEELVRQGRKYHLFYPAIRRELSSLRLTMSNQFGCCWTGFMMNLIPNLRSESPADIIDYELWAEKQIPGQSFDWKIFKPWFKDFSQIVPIGLASDFYWYKDEPRPALPTDEELKKFIRADDVSIAYFEKNGDINEVRGQLIRVTKTDLTLQKGLSPTEFFAMEETGQISYPETQIARQSILYVAYP